MATAEQYAEWIVANQDKKGSPEFETVAEAYKLARSQTTQNPSTTGQKSKPTLTSMDKVAKGAMDPIEGGAQLLYNILPQGVRDAGDQFNNWLADKTGLVAKLPEGGLNQSIKDSEAQYQSQRSARGEDGIDGWRLAGNVMSPANLVVASQAMKIAPSATRVLGNLGGKVVAGAAGGAVQGALMPSVNGDYWSDKGDQVKAGAAVGGALPLLGKLMPKNTAPAQALKDAGVNVPVGSAIGGFAKSVEDKVSSIPVLGDAINSSRKAAIEQFNLATLNKALAPIGESLPKSIKAGRDAITAAGDKVSAAYDALLPKLKIQADPQFVQDMQQLKQIAQNLPDAEMNQFNRIISNELDSKFTSSGLMSPETMKQVESELSRIYRGYIGSPEYAKQELANAIRQAQANLRAMIERNNPMYRGQLQKINSAFAALIRPERAAAYVGAEGGVFTPSQLLSAVKATDPSLRHKAFARGNALMQDWAEGAKQVLPNKIPNSGTADRLLLGGGALGGMGYLNPTTLIPAAAATAAYLPLGRQLASGALKASEGISKAITNRSPYATPLLAPLAYGGLLE